jgi:membrane protein DedA with SNARE-associated domain/membrane-associated phospholipid phosphatase
LSAAHLAAAVAAAALLAAALWRRRRGQLSGERLLLSLLVVAGLAIYASGVLSGLPDAKTLIERLADALGPGTYALVGVMAFLETGAFVGLIAPGEFTVIVGGVIAGQGTISIIPLIGLTWACCIAGDTCSFFIGRRLGRSFLERHGPKVKITHERLLQVDDYFARHGGKTILIGRFIGLVRAVAPFVAGSSGMRYRRFIPYSVIGTGLWATFYLMLGYIFYRSFDRVAGIAGRATFVFAVLVALVLGVRWARRRLRDEAERARLAAWIERQSRRPLLRPVAAVARPVWRRVLGPVWSVVWPQVRFVWNRITPGDLGLELTTALAIAGVGAYVFVAYLTIVSGDPGPTTLDGRVLDLASDLRTGVGVSVAKVVSVFGTLPVAGALVLVGAVLLAQRRRPIELAVLVIGTVAVVIAVHVTKGALDRPRPPHPLTGSSGSAFPSGHAAYATIYVTLAVLAARVHAGLAGKASLLLAAVAAAAAIGASRIALEVHWFSDVMGGFGLGAAIFGLAGAVGLVVGYLRNNQPSPPAPAGPAEPAAPQRVSPLGH